MINEFISFLRNECGKTHLLVKKDDSVTAVSFSDILSSYDMNIVAVFQKNKKEAVLQVRHPVNSIHSIKDYEAVNAVNARYKDVKCYFEGSILYCISYTETDSVKELARLLSVLMTVIVSVLREMS